MEEEWKEKKLGSRRGRRIMCKVYYFWGSQRDDEVTGHEIECSGNEEEIESNRDIITKMRMT